MKVSTIAKICLGINPGYSHENEIVADLPNHTITDRIQNALLTAEQECGIYVPFTVCAGVVLYKSDWGCPVGGEQSVLLEATRNPEFNPDEQEWKEAVLCAARALKFAFGQSTLTVTFQVAEIEYLN